MNVTQYTFQSPYSNQVQVGRPDPSSQKADAAQKGSSELLKDTNTIASEARSFESAQTQEVAPTVDSGNTLQTQEVAPTVDSSNTLDIYA